MDVFAPPLFVDNNTQPSVDNFDPPMFLGNSFDPPMFLGGSFDPPMFLGGNFDPPMFEDIPPAAQVHGKPCYVPAVVTNPPSGDEVFLGEVIHHWLPQSSK